ncbi:hypothetical protein D3C78_1055360 [compost metagenome]
MRAETTGLGPDEALLAQQLADLAARLAGDDAEVEVLALQQLGRRLAMDLHLHQRVALGEAREDPRQEAHHVIVRGADAHRTDHVRLAQRGQQFALQLEDAPRVAQQHLALRRQPYLAAVALEQRSLQHVLLQALHLHAHRRLGAVDRLGRAGEAALVGDGDEGAQQLAVDAWIAHPSISEMPGITSIRWIDPMPAPRLNPPAEEDLAMKGQVQMVRGERQGLEERRLPWWRRAWQKVLRWRQLARQRRQLAMLSDATLKDIGLSRADIWTESHRPFWDDR